MSLEKILVLNDKSIQIEKENSHNNENICERKYGKTVPNSWTTL